MQCEFRFTLLLVCVITAGRSSLTAESRSDLVLCHSIIVHLRRVCCYWRQRLFLLVFFFAFFSTGVAFGRFILLIQDVQNCWTSKSNVSLCFAAATMSNFTNLSSCLLGCIFDLLCDFEKLTLCERVCRRWRRALQSGVGLRTWVFSDKFVKHEERESSALREFAASSCVKNTVSLRFLHAGFWGPRLKLSWLERLTSLQELQMSTFDVHEKWPQLATLPLLRCLTLHGGPHSWPCVPLRGIGQLRSLRHLRLHISLEAKDWPELTSLQLESLDLANCLLTDALDLTLLPSTLTSLTIASGAFRDHAKELSHCGTLERLAIVPTYYGDCVSAVSSDDISALLSLPCVKHNCLTSLKISIFTIRHGQISALSLLADLALSLPASLAGAELLSPLSTLRNIRSLRLHGMERGSKDLTDDALCTISYIDSLRWLVLEDHDSISDAGIAHFKRVKLERLDIAHCTAVCGHSVSILASLRELFLGNLGATSEDIRSFNQLSRLSRLHKLTLRRLGEYHRKLAWCDSCSDAAFAALKEHFRAVRPDVEVDLMSIDPAWSSHYKPIWPEEVRVR